MQAKLSMPNIGKKIFMKIDFVKFEDREQGFFLYFRSVILDIRTY